MRPQNPAPHAHAAAEALARMTKDVRTGRAQWPHPTVARQGVTDLAAALGAMATATQQIAAALSQTSQQTPQTMEALHLGGQAATVAEAHLRTALRTLRTK